METFNLLFGENADKFGIVGVLIMNGFVLAVSYCCVALVGCLRRIL